MKLYYTPGACSLSPHIALLELGLDHSLVKVDARTKKTEAGLDFLSINPKGYVPALEVEPGQVLTEGVAIVHNTWPARKASPLSSLSSAHWITSGPWSSSYSSAARFTKDS